MKFQSAFKKFVLCAGVSAAALAAQTAQATVVAVNLSGTAFSTVPFIVCDTCFSGFYVNVVTGVIGTTPAAVPGWDFQAYIRGTSTATPEFRLYGLGPFSAGYGIAASSPTSSAAARFNPGDIIGPGLRYLSAGVDSNSTTPTTSVFGFKFLNETTGLANYGYMTIEQTANPVVDGAVRMLGYAYENSGAAITVASPVPEASTALMLLAGLVGVGATGQLRKRAAQRRAD